MNSNLSQFDCSTIGNLACRRNQRFCDMAFSLSTCQEGLHTPLVYHTQPCSLTPSNLTHHVQTSAACIYNPHSLPTPLCELAPSPSIPRLPTPLLLTPVGTWNIPVDFCCESRLCGFFVLCFKLWPGLCVHFLLGNLWPHVVWFD